MNKQKIPGDILFRDSFCRDNRARTDDLCNVTAAL